jgi:hypothetical protein
VPSGRHEAYGADDIAAIASQIRCNAKRKLTLNYPGQESANTRRANQLLRLNAAQCFVCGKFQLGHLTFGQTSN